MLCIPAYVSCLDSLRLNQCACMYALGNSVSQIKQCYERFMKFEVGHDEGGPKKLLEAERAVFPPGHMGSTEPCG